MSMATHLELADEMSVSLNECLRKAHKAAAMSGNQFAEIAILAALDKAAKLAFNIKSLASAAAEKSA